MNSGNRPGYHATSDTPPSTVSRNNLSRKTVRERILAHPDEESLNSDILRLLPATAESIHSDKLEKFCWKGKLEVLLAGTRDKSSSLFALRDHELTILREIYSYLGNKFARHVKLTLPAALVGNARGYYMQFNHGRNGAHNYCERTINLEKPIKSCGFEDAFVSFATCGRVIFPKPAERNVNMMPFILGNKNSLPVSLQCYFPLIEACPYMADYIGKVGFLTIHESYVVAGEAQRRKGLHIESPGTFCDTPNAASFTPAAEHHWGMGVLYGPDKYEGGIFMASSVANTSEVWDAIVNKRIPGIVDKHGGCEHLRGLIGNGRKLGAGELIWMTDCTPHEALRQQENGIRQFFRVVMPIVSHWYADHSTPNPKVPLPSQITVVNGNKFSKSMS